MKQLLDKASADLTVKVTSASGDPSLSPTHVTPQSPRYSSLKLDLPKFAGDILEWRSIFSARLNRETDLSEHERINCLENAMIDSAAKSIVRLHCSSGSYEQCVRALKECYDRNKLVYRHHTEKLFNLNPVSETYESISQLMHDLT